ncbi:hypothetical protein C6P88_37590, partial [Burkholderia contaminans]
MPEIDERFGEVGHDTLGAAVEFRRNGFVKRRDLGNSHGCSPVSIRGRGGAGADRVQRCGTRRRTRLAVRGRALGGVG